jgi:hypothetical protein
MMASEQCPSCDFQTETTKCQKNRARAYKNEKEEFVKNVPCPLWAPKTAKLVNLNRCPTCGQPISLAIIDEGDAETGPICKIAPGEKVVIEGTTSEVPEIIPEEQFNMVPAENGIPIDPLPEKRKWVRRRSSGDKRPRKKFMSQDKTEKGE